MTRGRGFPAKATLVLGAVVGLTACGGGGGSSGTGTTTVPPASQAPEITITPPANRAPRAEGSIPAQTLEQGGSTHSVDVASYFSDPDNDPLTYSVQSDDPGILRVSSSGSTITLTPVSAGTETVTVTAGDGSAEAVQVFNTTVLEPNRAPEVVGSIPALTLTEDGNTHNVNVASYFSDPDGDPLTWSAQSGDPGIVRVSSSGSTIDLTPVSPGNVTVTVTAKDGHAEAMQTFRVTVSEPNRDPEAVGSIPVQTLTEDGNPLSVDIAPYFRDPDGNPLTWSAQSSDPGVLGVSSSGSTVTLTPVSAGTATVTVTASDGHAEAVQTFRVTVPEPNRDPVVVGAIPTQTIEEGGSTQGAAQENDIPGSTPGQPVVAFTDLPVNRNDLTEGSTAVFTLTRTGDTASALTVRVSVSETGDMVAAGNLGERTVTFSPDSGNATLSVPTVDDGTQEADSVVSARIESNAALYRPGSVSSASVTILDDDSSGSSSNLPVVQVFQTYSTVNSGALTEGSTAELTLLRTGDTASTLAVRVTVSETGAMVAAANKGERTVTFASGSPTASMTVPTVDDGVEEAGSSLSVEIVANDDLYIRGARHLETIGILDDDESSGEAVWVASWSGTTLTEGGTGVTITLSNSNPQSSRVRPTLIIVHVGRDEGTAGAGDITVTQGGSPMARHKTGSDNRHHNGGWEYLGVGGGAAQVKITAVTNDGAEPVETLAVWIDADNRDVSSRVLTIESSTDTVTQD